jgi:hypothetical protein
MKRLRSCIGAAAIVLGMGMRLAAAAAPALPVPPCDDDAPVPAYSPHPAAPNMLEWTNLQWSPPACLEWPAGAFRFVVAFAGELDAAGSDDVLARLGAISTTRGLQYWSVTEQAWRVLVEDASALSRPDPAATRPDFSLAEMKAGSPLYFREKDNRSSRPVTYAMHMLEATPERVLVVTTNVDPIKSFAITFFPPGTLRTAYLAQRRPSGRWAFYLLSAASEEASTLVALAKESYVNRARAAYGHMSRIGPQEQPRAIQRGAAP